MDVFCDRISTEMHYRLVALDCAADIVRFSFVAQHSISPLDLPQLDALNSFVDDPLYGFSNFSVLDSTVQYPKFLINTEEKCRKVLSTTRDFLYRLHLDLPKRRERSLKSGPEPGNMFRDCFQRHIGKITVHPNFHFSVLARLVKEAIEHSDKKLKMIKWLLTFDAVTEDVRLNIPQADYFAQYMYPGVTESAFVKALLKKFDLHSWMAYSERSDIFEYFLFHLRENEGNENYNKTSPYELLEVCISRRDFRKIDAILKYQDAPRIPQRFAVWIIYALQFQREGLSDDVLVAAEERMSPKRFYLMVQLLFIFFNSPTSSAQEGLRLLWNSLADAFFSFEEIKMALQTGLSSETIRNVYNFYSRAVGVFHERVEPRSLKDLSRPVVRRILWESGCWIPNGVRQTGVPRELQSFLNLQD